MNVLTYRYNVPLNYITLLGLTITSSLSLGVFVAAFDPKVIYISLLSTGNVVAGIVIYAMTTKKDFTLYRFSGIVLLLEIFNLFIFMLFYRDTTMQVFVSIIASAIAGIYLIIDIQLVMDGKSRKIAVDDYILAAFVIYLDVINLFIEIVKIVDKLTKENNREQERRK